MGSKTTTEDTRSEVRAKPRTADESQAIQQLLELGRQAGLELGNMQQVADTPSSADKRLVNESIGLAGQTATDEMKRAIEAIMAQQSEMLAARGLQGSSIEAVGAGQIGSQGLQEIAKLLNASRAEGGNALLNLPLQRKGMQLNEKQQLYAQLVGSSTPVLSHSLQERLGTATRYGHGTSVTPYGPMDYLSVGAQLA